MLPTQELINRLAGRIERAYCLRRPDWWHGCSSPRVWGAAALQLWEAHENDPTHLPLDPELFVASQVISLQVSDPWSELTSPGAQRRYHGRVHRIIRDLRSALSREVRQTERAIEQGGDIASLLTVKRGKLSHLGCYVVACRAGRVDLANRFVAAAIEQHRFCPLYRSACLTLIPGEFYPVSRSECGPTPSTSPFAAKFAASLN